MNVAKCLLMCVTIAACTAWAQDIESIRGAKSLVLSKPLTPQQAAMAKSEARNQFKMELKFWLVENETVSFDTATAVGNHFFSIFYNELVTKATESSGFAGKTWTCTVTLPVEMIAKFKTEFNSRYDFKALHSWSQYLEAAKNNDHAAMFTLGLSTVFYASAHIGKPLANPAASGSRSSLVTDARIAYQNFLNDLQISYDVPVCNGKCGYLSENIIHITASHNGAPIKGISLVGRMPYGKKVFTVSTDAAGTCAIEPFRIPYGAMKGTFLTIYPNLGNSIDSAFFFTPDDFSLRLPQAQDMMIIFNTVPSTFRVVSYNLASVSGQTIPAEYQQTAPMARFLKDSCFLAPAADGAVPDLTFDIQWQISSYQNDETERIELTAMAQFTIKDKRLTASPVTFSDVVYMKQYDVNSKLPWGQFLWESSMALKRKVRQMLFEM